ncbi:MAG: acetate kinase [Tenericutes bacterium]|nr:acetate kinase [Mycoplasmatota bacterium]
MKILSVNAGSSSLKFTLFEMPEEKEIISGVFERIGEETSLYSIKINGEKIKKDCVLKNHEEAVKILTEELINYNVVKDLHEIGGVGHRVVHGGDKYADSVIITEDVTNTIRNLFHLAPLHNPSNLMGIEAFQEFIPDTKEVAVFDTGFHQTMPKENYMYAAPYEWYEKYGVRRYAYHGISHQYITEYMQNYLGKKDVNLITCHLGGGCSMYSIKDGKCFDTSMSFSTNSGLIMGTRSGDIDAFIVPYVMKESGMTMEEVLDSLNKKGGLLGVSGISNDSRDIEEGVESGNERCILAQELFTNRIVGYIGKLAIFMDKIDAICFTGGIGENSSMTRKDIINKLSKLGIVLDEEANNTRGKFTLITKEESKIPCYIVPTNEELMIAKDTYNLVK